MLYSGDDFYSDDITSPTERPVAASAHTIKADRKTQAGWDRINVNVAPGAAYSGWRITGTPIYGGFDFFAIAFLCTSEGVSIGDLVRSEHGSMYLRPHHSPHGGQYFNRWLYPIEPA